MEIDFSIRTIATIYPFGVELQITETIVNTWIIMTFMIIGAFILRHFFFKNAQDVPESGLQNFVELVVDSMDKLAAGPLGKDYTWLGSWFFMLVTFLVFSNISGVLTMRPPTADAATTLALSTSTFLLVQIMAFRFRPKTHIKGLLSPFPIFLPMNLIGEFAIIVSLGFRIFGNILAGSILMGLIYGLLPWFAVIGFGAALSFYFDLFAGLMQALIFTMLSMTFVGNKLKA